MAGATEVLVGWAMFHGRLVLGAMLFAAVACGDDAVTVGGGGATAEGAGGTGGASTSTTSAGGATCATLDCEDGSFCFDGVCRSCEAPVGTRHDVVLPLGDDEEDRFYFVHVPTSYSCDSAAPLLVDFHGTATGSRPEEAYQLDALIALADEVGAIVVRPRSRSSAREGEAIYRWDQNPGDLERNVVFTERLVAELRRTYLIDESRLYASGFSSGSNMASQFLGPARGLFRGLAPIAGGLWSDPGIDAFEEGEEAPRIYLATGYRDYLHASVRDLLVTLADVGVSDDDILVRESDAGHDLHAWHFEELWAFLDEGARPAVGELAAPWIAEDLPLRGSVLTLTSRFDGSVVATGAGSQVWLRDAEGDWQPPVIVDGAPILSGACADGSGSIFVVGEQSFTRGSADLALSLPEAVPEPFGPVFGSSYLNGIGCNGDSPIAAGGYWTGVRSDDQGSQWLGLEMDAGGYFAQASAVHVTEMGTILAVGYYDYIGRGAPGAAALSRRDSPSGTGWFNDVASAMGRAWIVGDGGTILYSGDDGVEWSQQASGTEEDLYAVAFSPDGDLGAAVGRRGSVVLTRDGGQTWEDASIGMDVFLGAATFVDETVLLVAGEGGLVASLDLASMP